MFRHTYIASWSLLAVMFGCSLNAEQMYKQLEEKELNSGVRYDSIFKGVYFGMPYADYREHCMKMHTKGEFKEGGLKSGAWVECKLQKGMKYPAALNFNPEFENGVLTQIHASLYYESDLSFPKGEFNQTEFLSDVIQLLEKWYGEGFIKIEGPDSLSKDVYVKINGNRRITVYRDDNVYLINIWFVDLTRK